MTFVQKLDTSDFHQISLDKPRSQAHAPHHSAPIMREAVSECFYFEDILR